MEIYTVNLETGIARRLFSDEEQLKYSNAMPVISPKGDRIAFVSNRSGDMRVWMSALDGSGAKLLSKPEKNFHDKIKAPFEQKVPAWSHGPIYGCAQPSSGSNDCKYLSCLGGWRRWYRSKKNWPWGRPDLVAGWFRYQGFSWSWQGWTRSHRRDIEWQKELTHCSPRKKLGTFLLDSMTAKGQTDSPWISNFCQ